MNMIIETTCNRFYQVRETGNPDLAHVWLGEEVRFDKKAQAWIKKPNRKGSGNRPQLVRKEGSRVVVAILQGG